MKKKTFPKRLSVNKETLCNLDLAAVAGGSGLSAAVACRTNTCADCVSTSCHFTCQRC